MFLTLLSVSSMDVKIDDEDKAVNLLCTLPESWGQVVSSINLSTTDTLEFDNVVGALLSKELRKKSSFETSSPKALVFRGRSKERGENSRDTSRSKSKGIKSKLKFWYLTRLVISRRTFRKDKNPRKMTPNLRQIQLSRIQV